MNNSNKTHKLLFIIGICTLLFSSNLFSQSKYKRKISISEWIAEMEQCKRSFYRLINTEIYYDFYKDSLYSWNQTRTTKPTEKDLERIKTIRPLVIIANCKLPENATSQVRNLIFQNNLSISHCEGAGQLIFYNCTFKQGFDFHQSELGRVEFWFCSILQRTSIFELQINMLLYNNCSLQTDHTVTKTEQCYGYERESDISQYLFIVMQNEKNINTFKMNNCHVLPSSVMPILYFWGGKYDVMNFNDINFSNSILNFANCSVKESFSIQNCNIKQPFGMNKFNLPKDNTSFIWSQIDSVGLGLYFSLEHPPYTHQSDSLISDIYNYNELNSSYRKFYTMYRTQGDMESANACFRQMKDMETIKYSFVYQQNSNINTWFNWRFNQFLKYFSHYGTNPIQSLITSMWVILLFAAVYFFFYSEWDGINRSFLIKQNRIMIQYFSSEQGIEDFYTKNYLEDFNSFAEYKKELQERKALVPFYIILFGKPLYLLSTIKHQIMRYIYRKTEILHGRWIDLKPARKIYVGLIVFILMLAYFVYLALIKALNATTLSVNAFSTLGFGSIPVKGVSRYITILEGFIGWFLLSIFSVSLISQMLQN